MTINSYLSHDKCHGTANINNMNCKKCKKYNTHTVGVMNTITKKEFWLCFTCWTVLGSKKYIKLA